MINYKNLPKLHQAIQHKETTKFEQLLEKHDINTLDKYKRTCLHLAAMENNIKIAEILMKHKASVNLRDCEENTPLMDSVVCNNKDIAELLLKHHADDTIKNKQSLIPITMSINLGNIDIMHIDMNMRNDKNETALHVAAKSNQKDILKILMKHGCRPLSPDLVYNDTILDVPKEYAVQSSDIEYDMKSTEIVSDEWDDDEDINFKELGSGLPSIMVNSDNDIENERHNEEEIKECLSENSNPMSPRSKQSDWDSVVTQESNMMEMNKNKTDTVIDYYPETTEYTFDKLNDNIHNVNNTNLKIHTIDEEVLSNDNNDNGSDSSLCSELTTKISNKSLDYLKPKDMSDKQISSHVSFENNEDKLKFNNDEDNYKEIDLLLMNNREINMKLNGKINELKDAKLKIKELDYTVHQNETFVNKLLQDNKYLKSQNDKLIEKIGSITKSVKSVLEEQFDFYNKKMDATDLTEFKHKILTTMDLLLDKISHIKPLISKLYTMFPEKETIHNKEYCEKYENKLKNATKKIKQLKNFEIDCKNYKNNEKISKEKIQMKNEKITELTKQVFKYETEIAYKQDEIDKFDKKIGELNLEINKKSYMEQEFNYYKNESERYHNNKITKEKLPQMNHFDCFKYKDFKEIMNEFNLKKVESDNKLDCIELNIQKSLKTLQKSLNLVNSDDKYQNNECNNFDLQYININQTNQLNLVERIDNFLKFNDTNKN
ncbi:Ankyrin repeat domain-containing protein [Intoshia linei]|uniref:Ankyrin repeat domain-containing protein n=1 Tax=Intoshia linei TaxID=1819745 RepID=A0A177B9E2_9BILA|nr:Ankyrin repeat domain-containing protein [Intoshia linei]